MKRRWKVTGGSLAVLFLLLAGLWLARLTLAERLLDEILETSIEASELTVTELTFGRFVIEDLKARDIAFDRLEARYSIQSLIDARLESLDLQGAEFRLRRAKDGGKGSFTAIRFPSFPNPVDLPPLPATRLQSSRIVYENGKDEVEIAVSGTLDPQDGAYRLNGRIAGAFGVWDLEGTAQTAAGRITAATLNADSGEAIWEGVPLGPARFDIRLDANQGLGLTLGLEAPANNGRVTANLAALSADAPLTLSTRFRLMEDSPLQPLLPDQAPASLDSLSLVADLSLKRFPWGGALPATLTAWRDAAQTSGLAGLLKIESGISLDAPIGGGIPKTWTLTSDMRFQGRDITLTGNLGDTAGETSLAFEGDLLSLGDAPGATLALKGQVSSRDSDLLRALASPHIEKAEAVALAFDLEAGLPTDLSPLALDGSLEDFLFLTRPRLRLEADIENLEGAAFGEISGKFTLMGTPRQDGFSLTVFPDKLLKIDSLPHSIYTILSKYFLEVDELAPLRLSGLLDARVRRRESGGVTIDLGGTPSLIADSGVELFLRTNAAIELDSNGTLGSLRDEGLRVEGKGIGKLLDLPLDSLVYQGGLLYRDDTWVADGTLSLGGREEAMQARLPLRLDWSAKGLTLETLEKAEIVSNQPMTLQGIEVSAGAPIAIPQLDLFLSANGLERLQARAESPDLTISGPSIGRLRIEQAGLDLSTLEGLLQVRITTGRLRLEEQDIQLGGLDFQSRVDPSEPLRPVVPEAKGRLKIGSISHPALATPAALDLELSPAKEGNTALSGVLSLAKGQAKLPLRGQLSAALDGLSLTLQPTVISFAAGGLQPASLSLLVAAVQNVQGAATLSGKAAWSKGKAKAEATVSLDEVNLRFNDMPLRGLNGKVIFKSLLPLETDGLQQLTATSFDPGMALSDLNIRFALAPGSEVAGPLLLIEQGRAMSVIGPLQITDGRYSLRTGDGAADLEFTRLDLSALTDLVAVEGLKASGVLAGRIPLAFDAGTLTVRAASLDDTETGTIRYRNDTTRQALAGGGESVELMLDALENFQYDDLHLQLDKPSDKELTFSISLEGKNPDVLDGYPFRLNFNLTTDPTSLLAALRQGTSIGELLLNRVGRFSLSPP